MIFSTSARNESHRTVLVLEGELDISTVGDFENALSVIEQTASTIVLDVSALDFVDCSGLHSFICAQKRIRARGGRLVFTKAPRHIERLFTLTKVTSLFEFVEDGIPA